MNQAKRPPNESLGLWVSCRFKAGNTVAGTTEHSYTCHLGPGHLLMSLKISLISKSIMKMKFTSFEMITKILTLLAKKVTFTFFELELFLPFFERI